MNTKVKQLIDSLGTNIQGFERSMDYGIDLGWRAAHINGYYDPTNDVILVNPVLSFEDEVILHELTHWTGHSSRMARPAMVQCEGHKKIPTDQQRADEEATAQMGALKLAAELGLPDLGRHMLACEKYLAKWPEADLNKAERDSNAAVAYILEQAKMKQAA